MDQRHLNILTIGVNPTIHEGGGVKIYTDNLLKGLTGKGHRNFCFSYGKYDLFFKPRLIKKKLKHYTHYTVNNSPVLFGNLAEGFNECKNKVIENIFQTVLRETKPDIIHVQNLMGLSASLIKVASDSKIPVIVSLHNYWFICPSVNLYDYGNKRICSDVVKLDQHCIVPPLSPKEEIRQKILLVSKNSWRRKVINLFNKLFPKSERKVPDSSSNDVSPNRIEAFRKRREYMKNILVNNADLLLAVSTRVKQIFTEFGVPSKKIIVNHIGTKAAELIKPKKIIKHTVLPIKFGYLGYLEEYKGFPNVLSAFKMLDPQKAQLFVHSYVHKENQRIIEEIERCPSIHFCGPYQYSDLPRILESFDVGIVAPRWHDNLPQIVFELSAAKIPIIGSNLGGIPDLVKDNENGLLFNPYQEDDLLDKITRIVENPHLISQFQDNIQPMKTMHEHIADIEKIYYSLLDQNAKQSS